MTISTSKRNDYPHITFVTLHNFCGKKSFPLGGTNEKKAQEIVPFLQHFVNVVEKSTQVVWGAVADATGKVYYVWEPYKNITAHCTKCPVDFIQKITEELGLKNHDIKVQSSWTTIHVLGPKGSTQMVDLPSEESLRKSVEQIIGGKLRTGSYTYVNPFFLKQPKPWFAREKKRK